VLQDDRLETLAYAPINRQVVALERCLRSSPVVCRLLDTLPTLQLPSWYIGAGAVAQTVWNHLHGFPPSHGLKDYDVVYFDPDDLTADGEQAVEANVAELLDSAVTVDVKNEARAHIWYQRRFGQPLMPYRSTEHAIATWPSTATSVGVRTAGDSLDVYAPYGLSDLFGLLVRPNTMLVTRQVYQEKAERWRHVWPLLTVLSWPAS
jgi:hypothetical protein